MWKRKNKKIQNDLQTRPHCCKPSLSGNFWLHKNGLSGLSKAKYKRRL